MKISVDNGCFVFIKRCPFCGMIPEYDDKTQLVHCITLDCALSDFYIHINEWNKRFDDEFKENIKE